MRHKFLPLLLAFALATGAVAQEAARQSRQASASGEVSDERLRAHVALLASERLGGRRTGTEGADIAADYIAREFAQLGLKGVDSHARAADAVDAARARAGRHLQKFPYVAGAELGRRNSMTFSPRAGDAPGQAHAAAAVDLRLGEDWTPLGWSANGRVERSAVVYVGYGIKSAELGHDDYAGVDARGRVAVAFDGTPDGDNPHGRFAPAGDLRFKAAAAREAGARALLVVSRQQNFKDDRLTRLRADASLVAGDAGIPVVLISRQVARRAVEASAMPSVTFEKLEQSANEKSAQTAERGAAGAAQGPPPPPSNRSTLLRNIAFQIETEVIRREAPAYNVVGVLEGSDARLKSEAVVVGAHYDHLGRGGAGSLAAGEGAVHHGADDNASGTAALLELARVLTVARPRRTVVFVAFGGEEEGLLGSNFYVNRAPAVPLAQTVAMFNMDMIGRLKEDKLIVGGAGTASEWKRLIERENVAFKLKTRAAPREGDVAVVTGADGAAVATANPNPLFRLTLNEDGFGPSDHSSFYARQIPVLFFWTGTHEDYHKPTDTADRINYEGLARVASFVRDLVFAVDAAHARPTLARPQAGGSGGRAMTFRVSLGTIPSYAEGGEGMKLDGVRDDSPAARAGLRAGDVIVRMAGRDVKNVYDYTQALGEMKAGEEYEVEVVREGQRVKTKITPAARRP